MCITRTNVNPTSRCLHVRIYTVEAVLATETRPTNDLLSKKLRVRQHNLDKANLAPTVPELLEMEAGTFGELAELGRLALDSIDERHDTQITCVRVARKVTIVCR